MTLTIGSLFSGAGGLDMAVEQVFGATTAWVSDVDKGACKILAHRYPDVPNLGDITSIDWAAVEPVDIITGGSPCQDLSHAGKRAGMTDGTRSNLWVAMREAIAQLKPSIVVWENVRGAYSAAADSGLEHCPGCMGDPADRGPVLRALGRVLGDLSDLGYDTQWHGLRAADVGAPHGRFRVFVVARLAERAGHGPRSTEQWDERNADHGARESGAISSAHATSDGRHEGWPESTRLIGRPDAPVGGHADERLTLLPTPVASEGTKPSNTMGVARRAATGQVALTNVIVSLCGLDPSEAPTLLPTPAVNDMGDGKTLEWWDEWAPRQKSSDGRPAPHGKSLAIEAQRLLPTPTTTRRGPDARVDERVGGRSNLHNEIEQRFGQYSAAIQRWEAVLGRPAPDPTEPAGRNGAHRLSPRFVEWLMGLSDGWITDVPGITRNEALKACGNGVVPQQAVAAINYLMAEVIA